MLGLVTNSLAGYAFAKLRFRGRDRALPRAARRARDPGPGGDAAALPAAEGARPREHLRRRDRARASRASSASSWCGSTCSASPTRCSTRRASTARASCASSRSIVLPLCRPVLVTLAIFTFLGAWNDFLWPLVVLSDERPPHAAGGARHLLGEHAQDVELMMAGSRAHACCRWSLLFVALQRHYLEGILTRRACAGESDALARSRSLSLASAARVRRRGARGAERRLLERRARARRRARIRAAGAASRSTGRWSARRTASTRRSLSEDGALEVARGRLLARAVPVRGRRSASRRATHGDARASRRATSRSRRSAGSTPRARLRGARLRRRTTRRASSRATASRTAAPRRRAGRALARAAPDPGAAAVAVPEPRAGLRADPRARAARRPACA